jgi:hypothetical protein
VARDPQQNNPAIISDGFKSPTARQAWILVGVIASAGAAAALYYASRDLTLSHYDARAHLVVARRIADSLTPGWRQIGAVWLPLPHLLNALPVSIDWNYRTGFSGVAISIAAMAGGLAAMAQYLYQQTGSLAAAATTPALVLSNPNILYLQSTPMTEPLLFGLSLAAVVAVDRFAAAPTPGRRRLAGVALAALVMTRYEGWCIAAALLGLLAIACRDRLRNVALVACYPLAAIAAFLLLSRVATGAWFVTSGFFVADNPVRHRPIAVLRSIFRSTEALGGTTIVAAGALGAAAVLWTARRRPAALAPIALAAAAVLPFAAFYAGHPHRIRYMTPLVVAAGVLAGAAVGHAPRRWRGIAALAVVAAVGLERPPFDPRAAMVLEAQWEAPYRRGREAVTRALVERYDGEPILASMGSLAHYMQDASAHGFDLADFLHEGNGMLWTAAFDSPRRHAGWVLIEERAEGGDMIAQRLRADAAYLEGFARVAEGGGVALYRRVR